MTDRETHDAIILQALAVAYIALRQPKEDTSKLRNDIYEMMLEMRSQDHCQHFFDEAKRLLSS